MGPTVDPLGDEFSKLLPEGFCVLLAPAVELPALKFGDADPDGACPVVVPFAIDPLGGAAPTPAVPLAPAPAPAAPPPLLCARAIVLVSASALANITAFIFIAVSFSAVIGDKLSQQHMFLRQRECDCGRELVFEARVPRMELESCAQIPQQSTIGLTVPAKIMRHQGIEARRLIHLHALTASDVGARPCA